MTPRERIGRLLNWKTALAEMLVIIAGVMLALAADRWMEERRDAETAQEYLGRLASDVDADLAAFASTLEWTRAIDASARYVLDVYRGATPQAGERDLFALHLYRASWSRMGSGISTTHDDLVSTGRIGLLPVDVRNAMRAYFAMKDDYLVQRRKVFDQALADGYWRVPNAVLGPDWAPVAWLAVQGTGPDFVPEPGRAGLGADDMDHIVAALRAIPDLEAQLAAVRHQMAQRTVIFGDRLPRSARAFREVLEEASAALD